MASGKLIWRGKWVRGSVGGVGVGERVKHLSLVIFAGSGCGGSGTGMGTSRRLRAQARGLQGAAYWESHCLTGSPRPPQVGSFGVCGGLVEAQKGGTRGKGWWWAWPEELLAPREEGRPRAEGKV